MDSCGYEIAKDGASIPPGWKRAMANADDAGALRFISRRYMRDLTGMEVIKVSPPYILHIQDIAH